MTKEQIREKHLNKNGLSVNKSPIGKSIQKAAFDAMEEYAKKIAISFKGWQDENLEGRVWMQYSGNDEWFNSYTGKVISTEQLYDIYLSQKKDK